MIIISCFNLKPYGLTLQNNVKVTISKRFMFKNIINAGLKAYKNSQDFFCNNTPLSINTSPFKEIRREKTMVGLRYTAPEIAKKLSTDGTGQHTDGGIYICQKIECEKSDCPTPCDNVEKITITGNLTKNPPLGFVSENLGNPYKGGSGIQYYAKANPRKEITSEEIKKDPSILNGLAEDKRASLYLNSSQDIIDKTS